MLTKSKNETREFQIEIGGTKKCLSRDLIVRV
jgi:hypothetical protein